MTFPEKYRLPLAVFFLVAVTVLVFSPVLSNPFSAYDDIHLLTKNPHVRSLSWTNIKDIFQSEVVGTYVPLTILSFAAEYHFVGYSSPFLYHLNNLLLHTGVVLLVFWLARRMGLPLPAALAGALIFAIHPMRVESVAWLSERKDVLYSFFYLWSVHHYISYVQHRGKRHLVFSVLLGFLSLLSKPMALSLPLALLVFDYYFRRPFSWKMIWDKIPYVLYSVPIALLTYNLHKYDPLATASDAVMACVWTFVFYVRKFLFPYPQYVVYYIPGKLGMANPAVILSFILLAAMVWALWRFRRHRLAVFAFLYYLASIFFILNYELLFFVDFSAADRFMYLPAFGLCLLLADSGYRLFQWSSRRGILKEILAVVFISLFLILGIKTYYQALLWRKEIVMWNKAVDIYPPTAFLHDIRGTVLSESGHDKEALADFMMTLKLDPTYTRSYLKIGMIYAEAGNFKKAIDYLTAAVYVSDRKSTGWAYANRGILHAQIGLLDDAFRDFEEALKLTGRDSAGAAMIYLNRGKAHLTRREYEKALADFNRTLQMDPRSGHAYFMRGLLYEEQQKDALALEDYKRALRFDPEAGVIWRIAGIYEKKKDWETAFRYYLKLLPVAGERVKEKLEELRNRIENE